MNNLETFAQKFADTVWGTPLVILLLGGGLFFFLLSRATPYRHMGHGVAVLIGRYDTPDAAGDISHKQALAAARKPVARPLAAAWETGRSSPVHTGDAAYASHRACSCADRGNALLPSAALDQHRWAKLPRPSHSSH